jgi:hypothetical protein
MGCVPALKPWETAVLLAALVTLFLFVMGPVWQHPWQVDGAIGYSYAPIPLVVAGWLAARRKLRFKFWALHTIEITVIKFMITASILVAVWAFSGSPVRESAAPGEAAAIAAAPVEIPVQPTAIDPAQAASLEGSVLGADGGPVEGALVFVAGGLEDVVFAAPSEPLRLQNDGRAFSPPLAGVQVGQPVRLESADRKLHTFVAAQPERGWILNVPMMGRPLVFRDAKGLLTLRCSVHGEVEAPAHLGVFSHPFFALTGADGRFRFEGVPARQLRVRAVKPPAIGAAADVALRPGAPSSITLALPGS